MLRCRAVQRHSVNVIRQVDRILHVPRLLGLLCQLMGRATDALQKTADIQEIVQNYFVFKETKRELKLNKYYALEKRGRLYGSLARFLTYC